VRFCTNFIKLPAKKLQFSAKIHSLSSGGTVDIASRVMNWEDNVLFNET
jgi:hypothetical protein